MNDPLHPINLIELNRLTKGDKRKELRYLNQFLDLVPQNEAILITSLQTADRIGVKQIVHKMKPQLLFFGLPNIRELIEQLEASYQDIPLPDLERLVNEILEKTNNALIEIENLIHSKT